MGKICSFCGKPYSGRPVPPSSWGFLRRNALAHGADPRGCYCSEKCRREAEGGGGGDDSSSSGSSSSESGSDLSPGCSAVIGKIITVAGVLMGLIIVLGVIFYKNEDANDPAVKMAKWEEHLEKRRAAFAEGLPEEGVEARGLKNYTWEEWQARQQNTSGKSNDNEKEVKKTKSLVDLWHEHMNTRRKLLDVGGLSPSEVDEQGYENLSLEEFKAKYQGKDAEAELKVLNARVEELIYERTNRVQRYTAPAATTSAKPAAPASSGAVPVNSASRNDAAARARAEAEARAKARAEAEAKERARAEAEARAKARAEAEAKAKAKAKAEAEAKAKVADAIGGQSKGTGHKASADSKGIRIVVRGKGKTKEAAVRWALREAVFKTVGTWVDSKARMQENHDKVVAQVKTITEADVPKFEIMETQEQDGGFVVKVRVSVSKKKIAPKFATVFPDVFGND